MMAPRTKWRANAVKGTPSEVSYLRAARASPRYPSATRSSWSIFMWRHRRASRLGRWSACSTSVSSVIGKGSLLRGGQGTSRARHGHAGPDASGGGFRRVFHGDVFGLARSRDWKLGSITGSRGRGARQREAAWRAGAAGGGPGGRGRPAPAVVVGSRRSGRGRGRDGLELLGVHRAVRPGERHRVDRLDEPPGDLVRVGLRVRPPVLEVS